MNVKDALIHLLHDEFTNRPAAVCQVVSSGGGKCTVTTVNGSTYKDVRLQANPANGILVIPKDDSYVIIEWISETAAYVAMFSATDSIQLMDGSYGGLIKITELVDKLNVLEQRMTSHQHLTGASAGAPTAYDITTNPDITETTKADLENPLITHGSI